MMALPRQRHYVVYAPKVDEIVLLKHLILGAWHLERSNADWLICEYDHVDTRKFFNKNKDAFVLDEWLE